MKRTLIVAVITGLTLIQNSYSLKFIAYGDSRTNASVHKGIVAKFAAENPELVIHSGDLWDGYASSDWKSHFTSVPAMNTLLTNNKILVARGNHETESAVKSFTPSIIRNSSITYAFREGNCFFVSMGYDPGANNTWLETQLKSTESQTADWRFIYAHKPVYSTGDHGADGTTSEGSNVTNFRKLCDTYKVTMFFAGHDHFYERTHWIYEGKTASEAKVINVSEKPGTFYSVVGGGGAPLYSIGSDWWVNVNEKVYHYCVLDASADSLKFAVKNSSGTVIDAVTLVKNASPYVTLKSPNGAEIWKQGETKSISWTDNISEKVKVELFKGGTLNSVIIDSTESDGEYAWTIPANQMTGNDYKIKITSRVNNSIVGQSSANFTIEPGVAISLNNTLNSQATLQVIGNELLYCLPGNNNNSNNRVNIALYDLKGTLVRTLVDATTGSGVHRIDINASVNGVSAGLYLCRMESGKINKTITLLLK